MSTNFPTGLDTFPSGTTLHAQNLDGSVQASPGTAYHSTAHGDLGDAIAALEAKVGVDNSAVTSALTYIINNLLAWLALGTPSAPQTFTGENLFTKHQAIGGAAAINGGSVSGGAGTWNVVLDVEETFTDLTKDEIDGISAHFNFNPTAPVVGYCLGQAIVVTTGGTGDFSGANVDGLNLDLIHASNSDLGTLGALVFEAKQSGNGTLGLIQGMAGLVEQEGSGTTTVGFGGSFVLGVFNGTMTTAYGLFLRAAAEAPGSIGTSYGAYIDSATGCTAAAYGLYLADQSGAGSVIAENLHSAGASSKNVFEGKVTVGSFKMASGAGASKVFTSDASGNASWQTGSASGGTVTTVSVVTANGFVGVVANATTTPAITLTTSITGILKGNGTAISAATADTDYATPAGVVSYVGGYAQPLDAALTALAAGSDFVQFSGPASTIKAFTLPNAACTILTTNAVVTVAQGGTGLGTLTAHAVQVGAGTSTPAQVGPGSTSGVPFVAKGVSADPAFQSTTLQLDSYQGIITADADAAPTAFDWSLSLLHSVTLTASRTITFSNVVTGGRIIILFNSGGTGAFTPVWPATVKWLNGAAPQLTNTSGSVDVVTVLCTGSNTYLGSYAKGYA